MRVSETSAQVVLYSWATGQTTPLPPPIPKYAIDVRSFRDPMGQRQFRTTNGLDPKVREWIRDDPKLVALIDSIRLIASTEVGLSIAAYVTVGIHEPHGKWIAPAVVEEVADALEKEDYKIAVVHRALPTVH